MRSARASIDMGEPERWTARAALPRTAEGAAGAALRRARDATEPREEDAARLYARLAARPADGAPLAWGLRLALALALLLATGSALGAAGHLLRRMRSGPAGSAVARAERPRAPRAPVLPGAGQVLPTQAPAPPALPEPLVVPRAVGHREAPRALTEARLLAGAFRALRAEQDPDGALRALDRYDRAFPRGALAGEARIARVEALMALGRRAEALALLATTDGGPATPTRNVLVMRGELFAEAGQCRSAVRDFDRILAAGARDDAEARALFGRAACRLREGDAAAGERDLRRYLERYPNGAFAAAAQEAMHEAAQEGPHEAP